MGDYYSCASTRIRVIVRIVNLSYNKVRHLVDACDLVTKRERAPTQKKYFHCEMDVLKSYADLSLEYRSIEKLYDFLFEENRIDYTRSIMKIQKVFKAKVSVKRNHILLGYEQKMLFWRKFQFKERTLLIFIFDRINEEKVLANACTLTHQRSSPLYYNALCQVSKDMAEKAKNEQKLQRLFEFDFKQRKLSKFVLDENKVRQIQNYWLRKLVKVNFRKEYEVLFQGRRDHFYFFLFERNGIRELYAESLAPKVQGERRYKVRRSPIPARCRLDYHDKEFINTLHPVHSEKSNMILFQFEISIVHRLQKWGRMKYFFSQVKLRQKRFEFALFYRFAIKGMPYLFVIYQVKMTRKFYIALVALRPKNRHARERQFFLHVQVSLLLVDEMYSLLDPHETFIHFDDDSMECRLKNILVDFPPTWVTHQGQEHEIGIQLNKQIQKFVLTSPSLVTGYYYLHSFDINYLCKIHEHLYVYLYPDSAARCKIGVLQQEEIKCIYTIQRAFRSIFYRFTEDIEVDNVQGKVRIWNTTFPRYRTVWVSEPEVTNAKPFDQGSVNMMFPPFALNQSLLSSKSGKFQVELWRKHSSSKLYHDRQVGKCSIKFDELDEKREFLLHKQIIGTKDIGYLRFVQKEEIQRFTMVEYLRGGIKFSIAFGLDFYDRTFNTLHALDHRKRNNYETCILELTRLLLQYTADEKIYLYGYSAVPKPSADGIGNQTSRNFSLTYDPNEHRVTGVFEAIKTYRKAVNTVLPSSPIIHQQQYSNARSLAEDLKFERKHLVYFILSSEDCIDFEKCQATFDQLEGLPLTIVVINVGTSTSTHTNKQNQVYFYDLKSYLPDLGLLQEEILQNVRVDFLNFAKVTNLSPQPDAEQ